ncbi:hypothetical protein OROHE_012221 [Orobanche hederae]
MADMRYGVRSHARSMSPRRPPPRPRGLSPSRHRKYSPYGRRRREKISREAETSWRIEKRDNFDRDPSRHDPRISGYGNRDRRCWSPPRIRSPGRIGKRDEFERDNNTSRNIRLPDNEDAGKAKNKDGVNVGRSMRSYNEGSYQWEHLLDEPRKSDNLFVKDYGQPRDYNGAGGSNLISSGGERGYYPGSRDSGPGRDGPLSVSQYSDNTKPVSQKYERGEKMQSHSYTLCHGSVHDVIPMSNLSGAGGTSHVPSISSCYLNIDTDKLGYARLRDEHYLEKRDGNQDGRYFEKKKDGFLGIGKSIGEETYSFKNEYSLLSSGGYVKGDSPYMVSSPQPRDYISMPSRILRESFPAYSPTRDHNMPSHMIQRGIGLTSHSIGCDGYKEKMENTLPRGTGSQLDDTRSASRLYTGLHEEKQHDQLYSEFGRSKLCSMSTRRNSVEEDPRVSRNDMFNPVIDDCFHKKPIRDDGNWDLYSFNQEFDSSRSLRGRKQELDMLGTGSSRRNYGIDGYGGYGSVKNEEHHTRVDGGQWSHVEGSDILHPRGYDRSFGRFYDSPRKMLGLADVDEPFGRRLRNKHARDEISYEQGVGRRVSADGNGAQKIYNREILGDENDFSRSSKNPKSSGANYEGTWRGSGHKAKNRPISSRFRPSKKSDSRDIKRRLGPPPHKLHVSKRLVKKYKPSIKKRLAPAPSKKHASLPWIKKKNSSKATTSIHDSAGGPRDREGDHSGYHFSLAKPEPPENSEDFKQLVRSAFFKFLKQINETPTKRKKYLEQGKAGSLKCIVCGSSSGEFVETESLARHAFTSEKVGYRAQHLGLHNALCALMGWKITEELTGEWHCEVMSNAETSSLKEDLIIWPPVVIIYNSTIDNKNHDERFFISTEKLDKKLRVYVDMGFGSILKVCNGKPANQSVMLVKFNGTLSGLQEAERYHKGYLESKHGRAELEQLKFKNDMSTRLISAEREDDFLYGHLGIAEDLDKLDFDTKKRCVLRSKKEILSIVNASFRD